MEYLDLTEADYDVLSQKMEANKGNNTGKIFITLIVLVVLCMLFQTLPQGGLTLLVIASVILRRIWYSGEHSDIGQLEQDFKGGQKIRFKARILNLRNVANSTTQVRVELGGNELDMFEIQIPIYDNINISDLLLIEVTPQNHLVLNVQKV